MEIILQFLIAFSATLNLNLRVVTSQILASQPSTKVNDQSPLVEGQDLSFFTFDRPLLKGIRFQIFPQDHVVLIGPSGHGKSTLLKIIAGLVDHHNGLLLFQQQDWKKLSVTQRNSHYLMRGMLFQKNALFDSLTVLENVTFPLQETQRKLDEKSKKVVFDLLEAVGLSDFHGLYPDELSGGMQKRLGIARALVLKPELLLLDDPVAGLDPITARSIIQLIQKMQSESQNTCVSIFNDMNRAFEIATRVLMVMDGQVTDLGPPDKASKTDNPLFRRFIQGEPE